MPLAPKHIEPFVANANEKFPEDHDEFHHYFKIVCTLCLSGEFHLFIGDKRTVKAICPKCSTEALIYDLAQYPSASKLKGPETFFENDLTKERPLPIYVSYEYGEFDDDQEFNQDEITWCQVWVEKGYELIKVFDDETA